MGGKEGRRVRNEVYNDREANAINEIEFMWVIVDPFVFETNSSFAALYSELFITPIFVIFCLEPTIRKGLRLGCPSGGAQPWLLTLNRILDLRNASQSAWHAL